MTEANPMAKKIKAKTTTHIIYTKTDPDGKSGDVNSNSNSNSNSNNINNNQHQKQTDLNSIRNK